MRNLKKIVSLVLALMMVLSMMVTASAAFDDVESGNKYVEAIDVMAELGILQGKGDGVFDPNGTLTRAEAAVILSKVLSGPDYEKVIENAAAYVENPFTDVPVWAQPYVLYCNQNDIVVGRGNGIYDPFGEVTGYEFAKMLLVAANVQTQFTTENWKNEVANAAKTVGVELLDGLTGIALNAPIKREQAAHMALNAMKANPNGTRTYAVYKDNNLIDTYDNARDAYLDAQIIGGTVAIDDGDSKTLLGGVFGVEYGIGTDTYGRAATVYSFPDGEGGTYDLYFNVSAPTYTYDSAITADDVKVLSDAKTKIATSHVYKDGVYSVSNDVSTLDELVGLGGDNSVVELHTNSKGVINNVVVINTLFDRVTVKPDAKKVEWVTIGDGEPVKNVYGLKDGDVVSYNYDKNGLANVTKLEGTTAKLGGLYKYGGVEKYIVNNEEYTLAEGVSADTIKLAMNKGAELVYYFGANNTIVLVHGVDEVVVDTPAVVYNNFAVVLKTIVRWTGDTVTAGSMWEAAGKISNYTGVVQLLLNDGKTVDVPVEITYATEDIKKTDVKKDDYYYVVGDQYITLDPKDMGKLDALEGKIVAYDDAAIVFAPTTLDAKTSGNVYAVNKDTFLTTTPAVTVDDKQVLVKSTTAFVVPVYKDGKIDGYKTVYGQASLGNEGIDASYIVYAVNYDATANNNKGAYTYTALVVFAHEDSNGIVEESDDDKVTKDYVMYTTYTYTEYSADHKALVDRHSMMKVDGKFTTYTTLHDDEDAEELSNKVLYELDSKGNLTLVKTQAQGWIKTINGNFYEISIPLSQNEDGSWNTIEVWFQLGAKATVYGELVEGNYVFIADVNVAEGDVVIETIFSYEI